MLTRLFTTAALLASLTTAQDSQTPTFGQNVTVVVAPTVVTTKSGEFVNDLKPWEFQLTDNGKLQNIKVDVTYQPISLVVAIQSNSNAEPVLSKIQKVGSLFKGVLTGEQGEVAVLKFDHRIQLVQDFTNDSDKIDQAFRQLRPGSTMSCMTDAVIYATRMLQNRPKDRRRVLLLISETRDKGSQGKVREALTGLEFANISVYTVNINRLVTTLLAREQAPRPDPIPATARVTVPGVPPTPENARLMSANPTNSGNVVPVIVEIFKQVKGIFVDNPVEVYTKFSGGKEHSFLNQKDLERAISDIGEELHSEYMISYTPNNKGEGGFHEIALTVNRPDLKIRTRPGYWIASQY